jgi:hypothetical protein
MELSMSNLQMYLAAGVPGLTILILIGILLDYIQFKELIARFDESAARHKQREAKLDIR